MRTEKLDPNFKRQFARLMTGLGETYNKKITETLAEIYATTLCDFTVEQLQRAAQKHMVDPQHGTFFPKPADFVRHIENQNPTLSVQERAEIAWSTVLGEIQRLGPYRKLEMDDKQAIAAVMGIGGWKRLCESTHEQLVWLKKEFMTVYDTYENAPLDSLPNNLPGLVELEQHKRKQQALAKLG